MYPTVFAQFSQMKSICPLLLLNSQCFGMIILNTPGITSFRPTSIISPHSLEQWTGSEYVAVSIITSLSFQLLAVQQPNFGLLRQQYFYIEMRSKVVIHVLAKWTQVFYMDNIYC